MEPGKVLPKRILLADDQQEVREMTKLMLDMDGHIVTEAGNGREALDLFTPDRFDLVITDYVMPLMKGDELARNIKRLAPAEPILMITGSATELGAFKPLWMPCSTSPSDLWNCARPWHSFFARCLPRTTPRPRIRVSRNELVTGERARLGRGGWRPRQPPLGVVETRKHLVTRCALPQN